MNLMKKSRYVIVMFFMVFVLGQYMFAQIINVTSPAAGASWCIGSTHNITWTDTCPDAKVFVRLRTYPADSLAMTIATVNKTPGSYSWTIPATLAPGTYFVRIRSTPDGVNNGDYQGDSGVFTICSALASSITVNQPADGVTWNWGESHAISWTCTNVSDAKVFIRLRTHPGDVLVDTLATVNKTPGTYNWTIPSTLPVGNYIVRIRSTPDGVNNGRTQGDSGVFKIGQAFSLFVPGTLVSAKDLQILSVYHTYGHGGQLAARVKCLTSAINTDVKFQVAFPESVRDGVTYVTRKVELPANGEGNIYLKAMTENDIPLKGLLTRVTIDSDNRVTETNENNNRLETRIAVLDLSCGMPRNELQLSRLYMQGGDDYKIRFKIHVRHNLGRTLNNVRVHYELRDSSGGFMRGGNAVGNFTFETIANGEDKVKTIEILCGKEGRRNAHYPRLREGGHYSLFAEITNPQSEMFDIRTNNNRCSISFTVGD